MDIITDNILRNPPVLLGLIAMFGLLVQHKPISDVIKGSLTAAFGMVILSTGVNMLLGSIAPINTAVQTSLGVSVSEGLSDASFTAEYGGTVGVTMFVALALHLAIARFTPIKTIFLTGNMLWWFPFVIVAGLVEAKVSGTMLIIVGAVLSALYWSLGPWITRRFVWDATGDDSFLIGHPTGILCIIAGSVARVVGDKKKSTEDLDLPAGLSFFREISITGGLVMLVMNLIVGCFIPSLVPAKNNLISYSIQSSLEFAGGLLVLLYGVRLLINQIMPAFQGIAEKVVPGAKMAFDVPILFNYRPNAVLIGFIIAMISSTAMILIVNATNVFGVLLVPLVITSFFECGGAAVIAEGQGGLRGAIIGTAVAAAVMVILVAISGTMMSTTIQNWLFVFGGDDLSVMSMIGKLLGMLFGGA